MLFSICICTRNRYQSLKKTIENLAFHIASLKKYKQVFEIIIVDNNSEDKTKETVHKMQRILNINIKYIKEYKIGISFARNTAIKEAMGNIIIFLDDDMLVDKKWFISVFRELKKHPDAAVIGGKTITTSPITVAKWQKLLELPKSYLWPLGILDLGIKEKRMHTAFVLPLPHIIRKKYLKVIGVYDTNFANAEKPVPIFGCEDLDFIQRVIDLKLPVYYTPTISTIHNILPYKLSYSFFRKRYFENGKEMCMFDYKHQRNRFKIITKNHTLSAYYSARGIAAAILKGKKIRFIWVTNILFWFGYIEELLYILIRRPIPLHVAGNFS